MMINLQELLHRQGFVVLDGGLATQLEALGADLNHALWSAKLLLESPQMLEQVNYGYLCAGADIVCTGSYQATIPGLMAEGLTALQAEAAIRNSVDITRQACNRFWSDSAHHQGRFKPLIAASIGPYGAYLHDGSEYRGNYGLSLKQLKGFHRDRMAILIDAQPNILAFESFPSQLEAEAIVDLLTGFPSANCWISFTCKDEAHISDGSSLSAAVQAVSSSPQVLAIGVNCVSPVRVEGLLQAARQATDKPLVAYPNSGACFDARSGTWDKTNEAPGEIEASVLKWFNAGARLIGGCCNTTPDTIRAIRTALLSLPGPNQV